MRGWTLRVVFGAGLLAMAGCGRYESCDPDQDLRDNVCVPRTPPADGGEAGVTSCMAPAAGFGDACRTDAECRCGANFCAAQPGQPGFCTRMDCMAGGQCPTGWACTDVSKFGAPPGTFVCLKT